MSDKSVPKTLKQIMRAERRKAELRAQFRLYKPLLLHRCLPALASLLVLAATAAAVVPDRIREREWRYTDGVTVIQKLTVSGFNCLIERSAVEPGQPRDQQKSTSISVGILGREGLGPFRLVRKTGNTVTESYSGTAFGPVYDRTHQNLILAADDPKSVGLMCTRRRLIEMCLNAGLDVLDRQNSTRVPLSMSYQEALKQGPCP